MACSEESFLELAATAFKDTHHHILSSKPSEMKMPCAHCDFSLPFFWLLPLCLLSAHFACFCFLHVLYDNHSSSAKLLSFACESEVRFPPPAQLLGSQKVSSFSFDLLFGYFSSTANFGLENLPTSLLHLPQVFSLDRLPSDKVLRIEPP